MSTAQDYEIICIGHELGLGNGARALPPKDRDAKLQTVDQGTTAFTSSERELSTKSTSSEVAT
jgi:hypothetical protein